MGTRIVANNTESILRRITAQIATVTAATAFEIEAESKAAIQTGPKTGRLYRRRKRFHQASAEGEAPATDTSNLVNSGFTRRKSATRYQVGYTAQYARRLEEDMNRPFLKPVFERKKAQYIRIVRRIVKR